MFIKLLIAVTLMLPAFGTGAQSQYHLNPGDMLQISVWNEEALQREVMVLPDGTISFPLVGVVSVTGKSTEQVQQELKAKLSHVIPDPEINLSVRSVAGNNFFIIGKVNQPGRFSMHRPTDVMQALSLAGGFTPFAKPEKIQILRRSGEQQTIIMFDYNRVASGKSLESNILLQSGDTLVVP